MSRCVLLSCLVHDMDRQHRVLSKVCRVGRRNFSSFSRSTEYSAIEFVEELKECFGIEVQCDIDGVHPPSISVICRRLVARHQEAAAAVRPYTQQVEAAVSLSSGPLIAE